MRTYFFVQFDGTVRIADYTGEPSYRTTKGLFIRRALATNDARGAYFYADARLTPDETIRFLLDPRAHK